MPLPPLKALVPRAAVGVLATVAAAVGLVALSSNRAQAQSTENAPGGGEFTFRGKPRHLGVVSGIFGVEHSPDVALELEAQVESELPDWFVVQRASEWTIFAHPSASAEIELLPTWEKAEGSPPSVVDALGDLVAKITIPALFTPFFRDPLDAAFGLLVGSTIMVRFDVGVSDVEALELVKTVEAEVVPDSLELLDRAYLVRVTDARNAFEVLDAANWLARQPIVSWAQPNFSVLGVHPDGPCQPLSPQPTQGELNQNWWDDGTWGIDIAGAWSLCGGADASGPLVTVGIIGDGVELTHPDLNQPMIGKDFVLREGYSGTTGGPVTACDNHETTVAGMIAMLANGAGGVGSAPRVRIATARAHYWQQGTNGNCFINAAIPHPQSWGTAALAWLIAPPPAGAGAKVVSYSWNHYTGDEGLVDAIESAFVQNDVLFVQSVGNKNEALVGFPSNEPYVLGVGAIDQAGQRWLSTGSFASNFGAGLRYAAPGTGIFTTDRSGSAGYNTSGDWVGGISGTSYAAPLVAGVAALVRALRPDLSAGDIDTILCTTAVNDLPNWDRADDPRVEPLPECGLIDAAAALTYAQTYEPVLGDDYETGDFSSWSETGPP